MIVKTELKKLTNYVKILLVINVNNNIKKIEDLIISIWNEDYANGTISELVRYMNENKNVLEEINSTNLSKLIDIAEKTENIEILDYIGENICDISNKTTAGKICEILPILEYQIVDTQYIEKYMSENTEKIFKELYEKIEICEKTNNTDDVQIYKLLNLVQGSNIPNKSMEKYINDNVEEVINNISKTDYLFDFIEREIYKENNQIIKYVTENIEKVAEKIQSNELYDLLESLKKQGINEEYIDKYIQNNIYKIMSSLNDEFEFLNFAKENINSEECRNYIKQNFEDILKKVEFNRGKLIDILEYVPEKEEIIDKNRDKFLANYQGKDEIQLAKAITKEPSKYVEENFHRIIEKITELKSSETEQNKLLDSIEIMIKEIAKFENVGLEDIKYVGRGGSSNVLEIGDKIFKTGFMRYGYEIPYHPRILESILRHKVEDSSYFYYIELLEKVDTKNISDEDVQKVYNELREDGILWYDVKANNLGRLLKSNKIHFYDDYEITDEQRGIKGGNIEKKVLPKGELVVLDLEYLVSTKELKEKGYTEEQIIKSMGNYKALDCEEKYQKERRAKEKEDFTR